MSATMAARSRDWHSVELFNLSDQISDTRRQAAEAVLVLGRSLAGIRVLCECPYDQRLRKSWKVWCFDNNIRSDVAERLIDLYEHSWNAWEENEDTLLIDTVNSLFTLEETHADSHDRQSQSIQVDPSRDANSCEGASHHCADYCL